MGRTDTNRQWTTYRILDATIDNPDLSDPFNLGESGTGKGFILWGDTSLANIEWDETSDRLLTTGATIRMGGTDKLEFRDTGLYIQSDVDSKIRIVSDGTSYDDVTFQCTAFHLDSVRMSGSARVQFRGDGNYIHSSTTDNLDFVSAGPIRLTTGAGQGIYLLGGHVYIGHQTADGTSDGQIWYHAASDQFRCRADASTLAFVTSTFGSNVTLAGTSKLYFRDTGLSISSDVDSKLRIISDGTSYDDVTFQCTAFHLDNIRMSSSAKLELRGTGNYIHASATDRVTIVSSGTTSSAIEMGVGAGGGIYLGGIVLIGHSTVDGVSDGQIWYDPVADQFRCRADASTLAFVTSTFGSNVTLAGTSKLYFRDTGLSISSDVDSKLRIISDGTSYDDVTFQCTAFHLDNIRMSSSAKLELRGTGNYIHASATDRVTIVSSGTTSSAIEMGVGAGGGIHLGGIVLIGHSTVDGVSDGQIWYDPVADQFKGRKAGATVNISTT